MGAFMKHNTFIRRMWSPVLYPLAGINAENWWRTWLLFKFFKSEIPDVKRSSEWDLPRNVWTNVVLIGEDTASAPRIAAIDKKSMADAALKTKRQTPALFDENPWLVSKTVGFEITDLIPTSDASHLLIPDSHARAPMSPGERNELLYSLTSAVKVISIGSTDAPITDAFLSKHSATIQEMSQGILSKLEQSAREEDGTESTQNAPGEPQCSNNENSEDEADIDDSDHGERYVWNWLVMSAP